MSKWDKLLSKILSLSKDIRFGELKKILEYYGYEMKATNGGSSHYTFRKPGRNPITIPKHSSIKRVYVQMVKDVIEKEEQTKYEDNWRIYGITLSPWINWR